MKILLSLYLSGVIISFLVIAYQHIKNIFNDPLDLFQLKRYTISEYLIFSFAYPLNLLKLIYEKIKH